MPTTSREAPPIPARGLGPGMLAGFLAWVVGIGLMAAVLGAGQGDPATALVFALVIGLGAWVVRPTTWAVPVLYVVLATLGFAVSRVTAGVIMLLVRSDLPPGLLVNMFVTPRMYLASMSRPSGVIAHLIVLVTVLALSSTAVLFARSRRARASAAGPPPP